MEFFICRYVQCNLLHFGEETENLHVFQCRQLQAELGRLQGHTVRDKRLCGMTNDSFYALFYCRYLLCQVTNTFKPQARLDLLQSALKHRARLHFRLRNAQSRKLAAPTDDVEQCFQLGDFLEHSTKKVFSEGKSLSLLLLKSSWSSSASK